MRTHTHTYLAAACVIVPPMLATLKFPGPSGLKPARRMQCFSDGKVEDQLLVISVFGLEVQGLGFRVVDSGFRSEGVSLNTICKGVSVCVSACVCIYIYIYIDRAIHIIYIYIYIYICNICNIYIYTHTFVVVFVCLPCLLRSVHVVDRSFVSLRRLSELLVWFTRDQPIRLSP